MLLTPTLEYEESNMHKDNPLIQVKDLSIHFSTKEGTVKAVDGLSFEVYPNEVLGVVGESGCGKSVMALSILNVLSKNGKIAAGKILFQNDDGVIDITRLHPDGGPIRHIRGKEIAMIFQEPMTAFSPLHSIGNQIGEAIELHMLEDRIELQPLDDSQTAGEQIGGALRTIAPRETNYFKRKETKRWVDEQTKEILRRVGMPNPAAILHAYPHNLSGGMRQRAMIAMALSCNPRVLIADEPTTALDVTLQAQVLELMREMKEVFDMSIIFITHDLGVVAEMADRVVVMYLGKAMEIAPVDDLFHNPKHPYTKALIQSVPKTSGSIEQLIPIEGTVPSPLEMPKGCKFHTRCPDYMPGICDVKEPHIIGVGDGHQVSCFLYDERESFDE
jgi:peptide/nickel transport system ATP-binding protein